MSTLLPQFLALVNTRVETGSAGIKLVDLGCGTGRNTLSLLALASSVTKIVGLDASTGMLDVARSAIRDTAPDPESSERVSLGLFDLLQSPLQPPECSLGADGVVSTLVLEHIPLRQFFEGVSAMLKPGRWLLVSNMHSELGAISQAGFVDPQTGTKIRPTSYCHRVEDVLEAAEGLGFEVVELGGEQVREREVDERLAEEFVRARKYVGVKVWFGICFRKVA